MPPLGGKGPEGPRRNIAIPFGVEILELCGYLTIKKCDAMFSGFDRIRACKARGHVA